MSAGLVEQQRYPFPESLVDVDFAKIQGHFLDALKELAKKRFEFDIAGLPEQWGENTIHLLQHSSPTYPDEAKVFLGVLATCQKVISEHIDPLKEQLGFDHCPTVGKLASMLQRNNGNWQEVLRIFGRLQKNIQGAGALAAIVPSFNLADLYSLIPAAQLIPEAQTVLNAAIDLVPAIMILALGDSSYWVNPEPGEPQSLDDQNTGGVEEPWLG